jgi:4,5-dihydroxyphthalate decarboxylase
MEIPTSGKVTLRTNLADYPVTMAMKDGRITSPIVELDYCGPKTANKGFKAMLRENAFEAGELAIITFLQAKAYGKPYSLLPYPISGRTQHHCVAYDSEHGVISPKDLEGRKVGVRSYSQTTGLWARGVLRHEYGVDLDKVTWMTQVDGHLAEFTDPPNTVRLPADSSLTQLLFDGEIAAVIMGGDMPKDERVRTVIPNAKEAGKAWSQREGVLPINHMFVVHDDVVKARPDVVAEIFRMLVESRAATEAPGAYPPIGLEANRKQFQMAIDWSVDQKIIPRRLSVDELFNDVTAGLTA